MMRWFSILVFVLWSGTAVAQTSSVAKTTVTDVTLQGECYAGQAISCEQLAMRYITILNNDSDQYFANLINTESKIRSERPQKISNTDWGALMIRIFEVSKRGCDLKSADSCFYLSVVYGFSDLGITAKTTAVERENLRTQNRQQSGEFIRLSCDYGSIVSCKIVADSYRRKEQSELKKAASLYAKTCDAGLLESCGELIELLNFQNIERYSQPIRLNAADAVEVKFSIEKGCAETSRFTCLIAAGGYLFGRPPFEADVTKGLNLLGAACEMGNRYGCLAQGVLLAGVFKDDEIPDNDFLNAIPKDSAKSIVLIQKACAPSFPKTLTELEKACLDLKTRYGL